MRATSVAVAMILLFAPLSAGAACALGWLPAADSYPPSIGGASPSLIYFDDGHGVALYAGGVFVFSNPQWATCLMRRDGQHWVPVPGGPIADVLDMVVLDSRLIVCSEGVQFGDYTGWGVAAWDGTAWTLIARCDNFVRRLLVLDGQLVFTGDFERVNDMPISRIARWDGTTVHGYGTLLDGSVRGLAAWEGQPVIYIPTGPYLERWSGSHWASVFTAVPNVSALCVHQAQFFIGGSFDVQPGTPGRGIARWNGSNWEEPGGGVSGKSGIVRALVSTPDGLLAGGSFLSAGGVFCGSFARWDGAQWHAFDTGASGYTTDFVYAVAAADGGVAVCGPLATPLVPDCPEMTTVEEWGGDHWTMLRGDIGSTIYALASGPDRAAAAGRFRAAGPAYSRAAASWDGNNWISTNCGLRYVGAPCDFAYGYAVLVDGPDTYVGGTFTHGNDVPASNIARWDGQTWHSLGDGIPSAVLALARHDGQIIAGGRFTNASGVPARYVAAWNGTNWSALGDGFNFHVKALVEHDGQLYAGGSFTSSGTTQVNHVARWDGAAWQPLGDGVDGEVLALTSYHGQLVAAGSFYNAGGAPAKGVAAWDGAAWHALGGGIDDGIGRALATYRGDLYVGGTFTSVDGVSTRHIARWDGAQWQGLDGGVSEFQFGNDVATVYALTVFDDKLLVGGEFWRAGSESRPYFALWGCTGPALCAGDVNCDGAVDFADIDPFVEALSYPDGAGWPHTCPWLNGDCNNDQHVDFADIDPFVARIGEVCP